MMTTNPRIVFFAVLTLCAQALSAQVTFTVTGTADTSGNGYIGGQAYDFVFTTGTNFAVNATSAFNATVNDWQEELTTESQIWNLVSGTAVTGTYVRPVANTSDPFSRLRTYNSTPNDELLIVLNADTTTDLGLRTPGGQTIASITVSLGNVTSFNYPGNYTDPVTFFSSFQGNYSPTYQSGFNVELNTGTSIPFQVTSVAITAVPEPSAWAALTGSMILLGTWWVRRRSR